MTQQQVGLDDGDLVATLHRVAVEVSGGAVTDRPRFSAAERIGIGRQPATLKLLDDRQRWRQVRMFAGDAPGLEPRLRAAQQARVGFVHRRFQFAERSQLVRQTLEIPEQISESYRVAHGRC